MSGVLYLYAVLSSAPRGARLRGLAREPLRYVRSGRLVAAVGEVSAPPPPRLDNLRGHDRVVRRLARASRAALPVRFGSLAESPEALRAALKPRARTLLRALERVADREQMTLHVKAPPLAPPAARGPGTRHLQRLAARDPRTHAEVLALLARLRPLVRGEQVEPAREDGDAGRIHHLVDRDAVSRYRSQLRRAARDQPELEIRCSGPWAPYSFTGEDGA